MISKQQELQNNKRFALIILCVAILGFAICIVGEILLPQYASFFKFFKYIFEAGIVGGLADWFAVVALFGNPLGQKWIPHTAIIPKNKDKIAKNLGDFIKSKFLSKEALRESDVIKNIRIENYINDFVNGNIEGFSFDESFDKFSKNQLPKIFDILKNSDSLSKSFRVDKIDFVKILNNTWVWFRTSKHFHDIKDTIIERLIKMIQDNENAIHKKLVDNPLSKIVSFLTKYDNKVINGVIEYLKNIQGNSNESETLLREIDEWIDSIFNTPSKRDEINQKICSALDSQTLKMLIDSIVEHIQENKDLPDILKEKIKKIINEFISNEKKMCAINRYLANKFVSVLDAYSDTIANYIESVIVKWDTDDMVQKLELEIGKDLQYIRINGTLVGGLIGGVFAFINLLISSTLNP